MAPLAKLNFVRQQGIADADVSTCQRQYSGLMFQPRIVGILVVLGLVFQNWLLFLALSAILWWNVVAPARNPFDALYNRLIAASKGLPRLTAAPGPRRFAQGMAGAFMLAVSLLLWLRWHMGAWVVEGLLVVALALLVFARLCLGSYIFHLLRGRAAFANRTLPWARSD